MRSDYSLSDVIVKINGEKKSLLLIPAILPLYRYRLWFSLRAQMKKERVL